jgi:hypothetical protein
MFSGEMETSSWQALVTITYYRTIFNKRFNHKPNIKLHNKSFKFKDLLIKIFISKFDGKIRTTSLLNQYNRFTLQYTINT